MEMVLSNEFCELSQSEMLSVAAGGGVEAVQAFFGTVLISFAPAVGVGTSIVATPVTGGFAAASMVGFGLSLIGAASHWFKEEILWSYL